MLTLRRSGDRGHARHGWLESRHTFSFAGYHDEAHMGFRSLRVINEDRVQPGQGFGEHSHRDMEIVTYVIEGALRHGDSLGNGSVIRPGDVQRMSAGTGITHSELNASQTELVHFLQIWILPERRGLAPSYEERHFSEGDRAGHLRLVASRDGRDGRSSWVTDSPGGSSAAKRATSWWRRTEPSRPSRDATRRRRPARSASAKCRCSYDGAMPLRSGRIQICRKWTSSVSEALCSLCVMPVPALMRCTSPGRIKDPLPRLSPCRRAPSIT